MSKSVFSMRNLMAVAPARVFATATATTAHKKAGKYKKATIPLALREQVWIHHMGRVFDAKCPTTWCQNRITVFDFESGHNIPESKGGPTTLENLLPLCGRCNRSMSSTYTFDEWNAKFSGKEIPTHDLPKKKGFARYFSCKSSPKSFR